MKSMWRVVIILLVILGFAQSAQLRAGGTGHGHGEAAAGAGSVIAPRVEARLENLQVVLVYASRKIYEDQPSQYIGGEKAANFTFPRIAVFLENFISGEPAVGVQLEAMINFAPEPLSEIAPGVYDSGNVDLSGGSNEIELNYRIGDKEGVLPLVLEVPGGETSSAAIAAPLTEIPDWLFILIGLAVYLAVSGLYILRRPTSSSAAA